MPRVPTRDNLRVLPGGGNARPVSGGNSAQLASVAGGQLQQVGSALQRVGAVGANHAEAAQDKINQARVREAALNFREDLAEMEREYQQYKGAELVAGDKPIMRDLEGRVDKRRNELMTGLQSPAAKAAFEAAASEMSSTWRISAAGYEAQQADFYIEQQRDGMIVAQIETAIADPKKRSGSLSAANGVLREKLVDKGYEGERLDQKAADAMGELLSGQVKVLLDADDTVTARSMLEESRDYLSPDAAKAIDTVIAEKERDERVLDTASDIWEKSDGDYSDAMAMAKMADEDDQEDVKRRIITLRERDNAIDAENKRTAIATAWEFMEQGGRVDNLPRETWEDLGAQTRVQLRNWEKAQAKAAAAGTKRVTDLQAYNDFYSQLETGDATSALSFLNSNAGNFSEQDYKSLRAKVSAAMGKDGAGEIESARTLSQSVVSAMERAGVKDKQKGELLRSYDMAFQQYQAENGEEPSDQWRDDTIEGLAAKVKVRKDGIFNDTTAAAFEFDDVGFIPEARTQAVLNAFTDVDEKATVSEAKLESSYSMAMAFFRMNGVNNPSDEALTAMIKAQQEGIE